ncbi:MAG: hypothetical protein LQ352_006203 [Teloschistes flavicans]|nr:MAG: hypothetical protein LQ352_006203 [Teloschistes flavicans]
MSIRSTQSMTPRAWGPLLALVSLFFLLFTYLYCGNIDQDLVSTHGHHQAPGKREVSPIVKSIALPFGNEFHSPNFSVPISQLLPQQKRDLEEDRQFFWDTRCRGLQFWNQVQDVYSGRTPSAGRPITYAEVSMAWNLVEFEGDPLQRSFNEWSQDIFGRIIPEEELNTTRMDQSKDYTSVGGVEREKTGGFFDIIYSRTAAAIIALNIISPRGQLLKQSIKPTEANRLLPTVSRLSDIAWYVWSDILARNDPANGPPDTLQPNTARGYGPQDPGGLRYIGHDDITNPTTTRIIKYILETKNDGYLVRQYPGFTFTMDEDEGLALLGSPNGGGTAYMLMDRFREMGVRKPTVTVWTFELEWFCMMWNLEDGPPAAAAPPPRARPTTSEPTTFFQASKTEGVIVARASGYV